MSSFDAILLWSFSYLVKYLLSSPTGPTLEGCFPESPRSQPNQTRLTNNQPCNRDAAWEQVEDVASDECDKPLVQSDEEDIQLDMSLVGVQDVGMRVSDECAPTDRALKTPWLVNSNCFIPPWPSALNVQSHLPYSACRNLMWKNWSESVMPAKRTAVDSSDCRMTMFGRAWDCWKCLTFHLKGFVSLNRLVETSVTCFISVP